MRVQIKTMFGLIIKNINSRKAILIKCLNCAAEEFDKNSALQHVEKCDFYDCPLFDFRKERGYQDPQIRSKAIIEYCSLCGKVDGFMVGQCPHRTCSLFAYRLGKMDKSVEIPRLVKKYKCSLSKTRIGSSSPHSTK